jgi:hypothetical protein
MRYMYDSTTVGSLPSNAKMVAVYANGRFFAKPADVQSQCPAAEVVWIDVNGSDPGAYVLDVENGDATAGQCYRWIKGGSHNGRKPTIYCSRDTIEAVWAAVSAAGGADYALWVATLDGTTKWNGRELSTVPGVVAVQVQGAAALGFNADLSYVYDSTWPLYPAVVAPPKPVLAKVQSVLSYSDGTVRTVQVWP